MQVLACSFLFVTELGVDVYEEVEAYRGARPVVLLGALSDIIRTRLLEEFPNQFVAANLGELITY